MGTLAAFALTCLLIELTPGPNMAYLALVGVQAGRRRGYAAVAGVALGLAAVGLAAALGVSVLLASVPVLYQALRWGGVAYLLYLAWDAWRDSGESQQSAMGSSAEFFTRGLITNLLNPKAVVFYVAILPTFIDPAGDVLWQGITLSAIYVGVATAVHAAIVTLAATLQPVFANPGVRTVGGRVFAIVLVGVAAWVVWATRSG